MSVRPQKIFQDPGGASEHHAWLKHLQRAVKEIRSEAAGRTCGGCTNYRNGWCAEKVSLVEGGSPLQILYANAPACGSHVPAKV